VSLLIGNKHYVEDINGFLVVTSPKQTDDRHIPLECPICELLMKDYTDVISFQKWQCCDYCYMIFVDLKQDKWNAGWRPSREEISNLRKKRVSAPSYRVR
jgi:hypothetical protein